MEQLNMRVSLKMVNIMEKEPFMMKMGIKSIVVVGKMEIMRKVKTVNV